MSDCKHAKDTGRSWCNCSGATCTEIECRNPTRLKALSYGGEGRMDGANWHTKYRDEDANNRENAPFVLVRSKYCCRQHCIDYQAKEEESSTLQSAEDSPR